MVKIPNCPNCKKSELVRKIIWGMPSREEDLNTFYIGGCSIDENPAKYICLACDYQFGRLKSSENGL